ncbi:MAG: hypothetical protein HY534_01495 [Chloroflexi bacterium]|nr:hypothetical protein [Chloroflexota bacterium]
MTAARLGAVSGFIAMRDDLLDLVAGIRFLIRLPGLLTLDIDPSEPLARLRVPFENRKPNFLERVYDVAYASPQTPYGNLFARAGCQYEDVVSMVRKEGIEGTLQTLFRAGIYLTFEELRGTTAVRRGNLTLNVRPEHLVNPRVAGGMLLQRGARGRVTGIRVDREAFRGYALPLAAYEIIRGSMDTVRGSWNEVSSTWLQRQVAGAVLGYPSERWFSQLDPSTPELPWRLR